MGAGRQTQTYLTPAAAGPSGGGAGPQPQRSLGKNDLGGVIFGCTHATMNECLNKKLFGLPQHHIKYVQHIREGMCLFLFNYGGRLLHGIYEAAGDGALNIDPSAWTEGRGKTAFPAQVKFQIRQTCSPLPEAVFKESIADNYYTEIKFTFELTVSQKDHLLELFTTNMQAPVKSISSKSAAQPLKVGGAVKVWKKSGDSEDAWAKPKNYANATIVNAWQQKGAPLDSGKGYTDDVKSYSFHHPGKHKEGASDNINESLSNFDKLGFDASESQTSTNSSSSPDLDRQDGEYPPYGGTRTQGQSSDLKSGEAGNSYLIDCPGRKELDKAARQRSILEKLQRLDPSRAENLQQQSVVLERFDNTGVDFHQPDAGQGEAQCGPSSGLDTSGGVVVAVTPIRSTVDWDWQLREKAAQEQAQLKEDRERLWVASSAVDMNAATVFKRSLEVFSNSIAQMRQDSIELNRWMAELRLRADQQLEQQKTIEKLLTANALLEQSQVSMAAELANVKLEMSELKSQITILNTQGQEYSNRLLFLSTSGSYHLGGSLSSTQQVLQPQGELYILGGLANEWLDSVVAYSPVTMQCRAVAPLLAPRSYAATSILDGHIYLYGGGDGSSWSDSVERYNRNSDTWEKCPSMGIKRGSLGGATVRDKIYALGGGNGAISFDDTECFDPNIGTWIPSTKMLERRFCVAAAELNGAIYALGGFDGVNYLMSMERFDPREGLWTPLAPMTARRGSLSAAFLNESLYALGGFDGRNFLNSVELYDPRANGWMPGSSMICARAYGASAVFGNALYMLGGMEFMNQSFETSTMKMERYQEVTGWQPVAMNNMINRNFVAAAVL